jgi:peptidoglycan DL-endopeptidase CwlO
MSPRRFALLTLVFVAFAVARAGVAFAKLDPIGSAPKAPPLRVRVVRYATRFIGIRYVYGGTTPRTGFDCSGFTRFVYAHFGIALPHYSGAQFERGREVSRGTLRLGDLVFFDGLGHVGLYVGRGRFIHAPHTGTRVEIDPLSYGGGFVGGRRLI